MTLCSRLAFVVLSYLMTCIIVKAGFVNSQSWWMVHIAYPHERVKKEKEEKTDQTIEFL